jgi:P-type Ca2+ transporter type 2C
VAERWHALSVDDAFARLDSGPAGLGSAEAQRRLAAGGPNELELAERVSPWGLLAEQFRNVLVLILLVAAALSAVLGHGLESIVIAVIVLFAVLLGFAQEYRAERALESLRRLAAPAATVVRDGLEARVPAREVVPGDLLVLHTGDRLSADARVVEAVNLKVEESALTGESVPVEKRTEAFLDEELPVADRRDMVHAGTSVTYGRGRAVVVATGMATEFGKIARLLQTVEAAPTPLQRNLDRVGTILARVALGVVVVIVAAGLWRGQPLVEMLVFGIALGVAAVPEALPAVVTISLALGVQRMARRNALVRRLPAVETLGSTTVICSDKTGTLTRNEMTARRVLVGGDRLEVSGAGYAPEGVITRGGAPVEIAGPLRALLEAACLASDARLVRHAERPGWRIAGDPTEGALVVLAAKAGIAKDVLEAATPRVGEIPFSAESKRMTTLHRSGDRVFACAKGAPEVLLAACDTVLTPDGVRPLDATGREEVAAEGRRMADDALRVLAVARKEEATLDTADRGLTLLGLVGMIDPPRDEALEALPRCRAAGIRAVMITGDHPATACAVAREIGILARGRVVTGRELDGWSDAALRRDEAGVDVWARVSPAHKLRIVAALQANGEIVAMTGDGVNDAPALQKADIGIAMGIAGTDVSRDAAAMTLTDDSFASIVAAVEEGRRVYGNVKKYLMYLLSSNLGEIGLMAGAVLLGLPLPLTAVQILWVNLATDGLPALALAVDPPEPDLMRRPPRDPRRGIFTRPVVTLLVAGGAWSTLANVSLFAWALGSGRSQAEAMAMTFVSLALIQFVKAYNYRSDRRSVLERPFANRWLNLAVGWEIGLLVLLVHVPWLQRAFGTFPLTWQDWAIVTGVALTIAPVLEAAKWMERRGWFGTMD